MGEKKPETPLRNLRPDYGFCRLSAGFFDGYCVVNEGPLATVYYTIGVSRLSRENQRVVKAVAAQMNSDKYANTNFVLTGWADNYTGTEAINARLRAKRAEGVRDKREQRERSIRGF